MKKNTVLTHAQRLLIPIVQFREYVTYMRSYVQKQLAVRLFFLNDFERFDYTLVVHTAKIASVLLKLLLDKKKLYCSTVRPKITVWVAKVLKIQPGNRKHKKIRFLINLSPLLTANTEYWDWTRTINGRFGTTRVDINIRLYFYFFFTYTRMCTHLSWHESWWRSAVHM